MIIIVSLLFILFYYFIGLNFFFTDTNQFLLFIGFSKLNITVVKYIYQIYILYDRKNTYGMSIWSFISDFIGGILSLIQQFIGTFFIYGNDSFNVTRFVLGVVTVFFGLIIFYKYFYLYK